MNKKLVLIGASTGGPGQLKSILMDLPKDLKVPIVIAQHMGSMFIPSFIDHFDNMLKPQVVGFDEKKILDKGGVYICKENSVISSYEPLIIEQCKDNITTLYNPNVNILFNSVVSMCDKINILAILLTGIGDDGALGLANIAKSGGTVFGESENSAIVYGMPKKAKELNPSLEMLHVNDIKTQLERFINVF